MTDRPWWRRAGDAAATGAVWVGRRLSDAYHSVDADARRQILEMPLLGYSLFVPTKSEVVAGEPDGYRPVVFVHGLGGRRGDFLLMDRYFNFLGRRRTYRLHLAGLPTVEERAERLGAFIGEILEKTGEQSVDIVAHSLGGLVARLAISERGFAPRVHRLVTLGTPHRGTHLARLAGSGIARGLRPGSPLFERLDAEAPGDYEAICFWSRADIFISPAEAAIWPESRGIELSGLTHYGYLLSPRAWEAVYRVLDDEHTSRLQKDRPKR